MQFENPENRNTTDTPEEKERKEAIMDRSYEGENDDIWGFFDKWGFGAEHGEDTSIAEFFSQHAQEIENAINQQLEKEAQSQAEQGARVEFYETSSAGNCYRAHVRWVDQEGAEHYWNVQTFTSDGLTLPQWIEDVITNVGDQYM